MDYREIRLKVAIFAGVAVLSLPLLTSTLRRPTYGSFSGIMYPQYGVMLLWKTDAVEVTVEGREECVPKAQLASSAIYQEAISRIPRADRPALTEVHWNRVFCCWAALNALTWHLLFRVWQPIRPYIEGPRSL